MNKRIKWIDVAKFFGIFAIYLGHFATDAGKLHPFVFAFHVPLFFLISGCMESIKKEENFISFFLKKFNNILLPFFVFSLISIFISGLQLNGDISYIKNCLIIVGKGAIRNSFVALSLWFLTCLFVVEIIFKVIELFRKKWLIFILSLLLFLISYYGINHIPLSDPRWIYNIDSALYYIIYYALGYISFPYITKLFKLDTAYKRIIYIITGIASLVYSFFLFEGLDILNKVNISYLVAFIPVLRALIVIWLVLFISRLCEGFDYFVNVGSNSLYLCGSEFIIKSIIATFASIFGLNIILGNPFVTFVYAFILLASANKYLVPIEKQLFKALKIENISKLIKK